MPTSVVSEIPMRAHIQGQSSGDGSGEWHASLRRNFDQSQHRQHYAGKQAEYQVMQHAVVGTSAASGGEIRCQLSRKKTTVPQASYNRLNSQS